MCSPRDVCVVSGYPVMCVHDCLGVYIAFMHMLSRYECVHTYLHNYTGICACICCVVHGYTCMHANRTKSQKRGMNQPWALGKNILNLHSADRVPGRPPGPRPNAWLLFSDQCDPSE